MFCSILIGIVFKLSLLFRSSTKSEDVQYMKFDSEGNLYLYEPGAGISGESRHVISLGSDEIIYQSDENGKKHEEVKPNALEIVSVNRLILKKGASAMRYLIDLFVLQELLRRTVITFRMLNN